MRFICVLFLSLLAAIAMGQATPGPDVDRSWQRSYPAGPYSQINTSTGSLDTQIPIMQLDGKGKTALSLYVRHRSNQATLPGQYSLTVGGAGRGWYHSYDQELVASPSAGIVQKIAGNGVQAWQGIADINGVYPPQPGTRDKLSKLFDSGSNWIGWQIETQTTHIIHQYKFDVGVFQMQAKYAGTIDPYGNVINIYYEGTTGNYRVRRVVDASSRELLFTYQSSASNAQLTSVQLTASALVRTWSFYIDPTSGLLGAVTWPVPGPGKPAPYIELFYNLSNTNLSVIKDKKGYRWEYGYDPEPLSAPGSSELACVSVMQPLKTDPTNQSWSRDTEFAWTYVLNGFGQATEKHCTIAEPMGPLTGNQVRTRKHIYKMDGPNNNDFKNPIYKVVDPTITDPYLNPTTHTFFETYTWNYTDGTLTTFTDREGNQYSFTYVTGKGLIASVTNPITTEISYLIYDSADRLILTDAPGNSPTQGRRMAIYYNSQHDPVTVIVDPQVNPATMLTQWPGGLNLTTNTTYKSTGGIDSTWIGSDNATEFVAYDAYGNATQLKAPNGKNTNLSYNALNEKLTEAPPTPSGTTSYEYDALSRLTKVTHPDSTTIKHDYDSADNKFSTTNENNFTTLTTFDHLHRVASTRVTVDSNSANDLITSFEFDAAGNISKITNPKGEDTIHSYNERDDRNIITYPDSTTRKLYLTGTGKPRVAIDGKGQRTNFVYDDDDRLLTIERVVAPSSDFTAYTYNPDGTQASMSDSNALGWGRSNLYYYDTAGRLIGDYETTSDRRVKTTYVGGNNRKETLSVFQGNTTTGTPLVKWGYAYEPSLSLDTIHEQLNGGTNSLVVSYSWKDNGLMAGQFNGNGTSTVLNHNNRSQVVTISHRRGTTVEQSFNYDYDDVGNITSYNNAPGVYAPPSVPAGTTYTDYTYDRANRLIDEHRFGSPHASQNYQFTYNLDKQGNRSSVVRNGVTSNYSYISNDRFTSGDGFTFSSYDNNGSPTSVTGGGVTTTFTYDRDNRVSIAAYSTGGSDSFVYDGEGKRIQRTAGGSTTTFVYDGATLIGEIVGSASTYHIPGVSYTDSAGARRWYRDNHLGSYVQATNSAGNIVTELEYDAFGQEELLAGSMIANHRFAGKHGYYKDSTSGLMLLGARYYAAKLGRFINQDPIGHSGGLNLYLYCHANPVNEIDPDGTDGFTDFVAGWGDTLSFGATKIARKKLGEFLGIGDANEAVNYDSGYYKGGQAVGVTHSLAFGGVGAAKAFAGQGAKVAANYAQVLQATKLKGLTGIIEKHHLLPTQFLKEFKRVGLNIDDYLKPLDRAIHKLIHGKGGGQLNQLSWNKNWEAFFQRNPQATAKQILKFKDEMVKKFKL